MTHHRPLPLAIALAALLAVAGCAGGTPDDAATGTPPHTTGGPRPAQPAVAAPPPPRPAPRPQAELNALRPSPRPNPNGDTAQTGIPKLVGLSEDETIALLGRPTEEAAQPPGKVFLYRANGCRLSVHLFPDMDKGGFYALDYAADGNRETCLGKVAGEARRRGGALAVSAKVG